MVSTFTPNKNIEQPAHNDYVNTWDVPVNADWGQIDKAFGNSTSKNAGGLSGNQTLAVADYVPLTIIITGLPTAAITYVVPSGVGGQWVFANATTGGFNVGIKSNAGGTTILCPAGQNTLVSCDGSSTGMRLSITTNPVAAGSNTQVQFNSGGITAASANFTFDGTTVSATGLNVAGNAVLGSGAGSTLTINGTAVSTPNGLNFDANTLVIDATNNRVGVGTPTPGHTLSVAGNIESMSGGFIFPDGSVQLTAAASAGSSITYLAADVNLGAVNSVHNVVNTGSIGAAGQIWLIIAKANMQGGTGQAFLECAIFNGTSYLASSEVVNANTGQTIEATSYAIATLSGPTTFTMRCVDRTIGGGASSVTSSSLQSAGSILVLNKATSIAAIRLS